MFRIRNYIDKIFRHKLTKIEQLIDSELVSISLLEYFQSFKKMNDNQSCKNLYETIIVIVSQGYYLQEELMDKFGKDFFLKLLNDQEVYFFLFIYLF